MLYVYAKSQYIAKGPKYMLANIECMIKEYLGPTIEYMLYFK